MVLFLIMGCFFFVLMVRIYVWGELIMVVKCLILNIFRLEIEKVLFWYFLGISFWFWVCVVKFWIFLVIVESFLVWVLKMMGVIKLLLIVIVIVIFVYLCWMMVLFVNEWLVLGIFIRERVLVWIIKLLMEILKFFFFLGDFVFNFLCVFRRVLIL